MSIGSVSTTQQFSKRRRFGKRSIEKTLETSSTLQSHTREKFIVEAAAPVDLPPIDNTAPLAWHEASPPKPLLPNSAKISFKKYWFTDNAVVSMGVLLLLIGVGFLLKYSFDHFTIPIELRLAGIASSGVGLLAIGWLLRIRRDTYALALQGGGISILYLTLFAALRLYELLPVGAAFSLLVVISLFSAILAILQNASSLAILGTLGGFLAPVLIGADVISPIILFSYYVLLNVVVLSIACFKSWRLLNLIGFFFTFTVMSGWVYRFYVPTLLWTIEPFLILFFVMYVVISILFALKQTLHFKNYVDSTIIFGTPIAAFSLQIYFVNQYAYGLAYSALLVSLFYLSLAWFLIQKYKKHAPLLIETFLALGIIFATIAIPMALNGQWTATVWALEGAGMVWLGLRQERLFTQIFGILVLLGASAAFCLTVGWETAQPAIFNPFYLERVFIALSTLFTAYWLQREREQTNCETDWQYAASLPLLILGLLWWFIAGMYEIGAHAKNHSYLPNDLLLFISLSFAVIFYVSRRLSWKAFGGITHAQLWIMYIWLFGSMIFSLIVGVFSPFGPYYNFDIWTQLQSVHLFAYRGYLAWPAAFVVHYALLLYCRDVRTVPQKLRPPSHAAALWLLAIVLGIEFAWVIQQLLSDQGVWTIIGWALAPILLITGVTYAATNARVKQYWPMRQYSNFYLRTALLPLLVYGAAWSIVVNLSNSGNPWPLPYVPFLNPLDLAQGFVILACGYWCLKISSTPYFLPEEIKKIIYGVLSGMVFIWLTAILIRTLHYWMEIPFNAESIFSSSLVQTSVSIFWTTLALCMMIFATRNKLRLIWLVGGGLLAIVVIKLFLIDLANTGTLARIISFIGVGVLLLLVGYLSPVPPKESHEAQS